MKILLIEDDKEVALLIKHSLAALHMQVDIVYTGEEAIRLIKLGYYDVILVDLLLNIALNGLEVVRLIRKLDKNIPLIAVTALQDIETKVSTFQAGVDDYVTKPFHFQELAARVQRLCKRISRPYVTKLCYRGITYDIEKRSVVFQQHKIFLKNKEGKLFEYLINHAERPLSRHELINSVWHLTVDDRSNIVDVSVRQLRQKIDRVLGLKLIHTVHGVGYRLAL